MKNKIYLISLVIFTILFGYLAYTAPDIFNAASRGISCGIMLCLILKELRD